MTLKKLLEKIDFSDLRKQKDLLVGIIHDERLLPKAKRSDERQALLSLATTLQLLINTAGEELGEKTAFGEGSNMSCLEGIKCPKCGQETKFEIEVNTMTMVTDEGTYETRDIEWSYDSSVICPKCGKEGRLWQFTA